MVSPERLECLDEPTLAALIDGRMDLHAHPKLEAHLASCEDCRHLIGAAATGIAGTGHAEEAADPAELPQRGEVLAGKYRIEGMLGRGGMGVVLAARHLELGQSVAIKILHSGAPTATARFLREAATSAQLVNEHIARVFDLGRLPNGTPFIVMEYLVGEDLSRVIARGRVSAELAVDYALQACRALAEAHTAGVVHRDLKPGNLFLTRRADGSPWLKVLDFGISKHLSSSLTEESQSLTATAAVLGSPVYMSPEQIRADKQVDARTDIWSLGVVLYELLTGQRPFKGPTLSALAVAIATEAPPSPSSLMASLSPALETVVLRCLEKQPTARFASILELAEALRGAQQELRAGVAPSAVEPRRSTRVKPLIGLGLLASALTLYWLTRAEPKRAEAPPTAEASTAALRANDSAAMERREAARAASIHCDAPLPAGTVQLSFGAAAPGSARRQHSVPVAALCGGAAGAGAELAALDDLTTLTAASLEPPHPFYSLTVHEGSLPILELKRAAQLHVEVELLGAACSALGSIEVVPEGLPAVRALPARAGSAAPVPAAAACNTLVELPFAAFGKALRFQFATPGVTAAQASFSGSKLQAKLALPKRPKAKAAERCAPPHFYNCRE